MLYLIMKYLILIHFFASAVLAAREMALCVREDRGNYYVTISYETLFIFISLFISYFMFRQWWL